MTDTAPLKIVVIGCGYVGLVTGACLASLGRTVVCVDTDVQKVDGILKGRLPIYEPGLDDLVKAGKESGRLSFDTKLDQALPGAKAAFIAVGTPSDPETGRADLVYVIKAAEEIAKFASNDLVLVHKSTVPVGTGDQVEGIFESGTPGIDSSHQIEVASNPEFLREGQAIGDFMNPDRLVIGVNSTHAEQVLRDIYRPLTDRGVPILVMGRRSAEMVKYAANAYLAIKVAFVNEVADICEKGQADIADVAHGIGLDRRISPHFLSVGPGFGGSCFPKDTSEMAGLARMLERPSRLIEAAIDSNNDRKNSLAARVVTAIETHHVDKLSAEKLSGWTIAVLGLTFKAGTDDMRDSAALSLVPDLLERGAIIQAYDPEGMENSKKLFETILDKEAQKRIHYMKSVEAALQQADLAVILTEWPEFSHLAPDLLEKLSMRLLLDFRNLYDPAIFAPTEVIYASLGR